MSQANGRYSGSRDKNQLQSRQPSKATAYRQRTPYVNAPPTRDPTQTASIFKTRSFKLLVDVVGAENIALGLDSNLTRVAELINGEKFTPETAFHIETTLGLPDGFFDQPNPALPPEIVERLKSPLDFIHANAEPESTYEQGMKPAPVTEANHHPALIDHPPRGREMPKKTNGRPSRSAAKTDITAAKPATVTPPKSAPTKPKASSKARAQQDLPLNDVAALEAIRRTNLHVLTSAKGSKVRLGAVMELSGSNMANRLYGQKRMNDIEANRFTERLGLPSGWLDVPHSAADIPESVSDLLAPASRSHTSSQQDPPPSIVPRAKAKKAANTKVGTTRARIALVRNNDGTGDPIGAASETNAVREEQDQVPTVGAEPANRQPIDKDIWFPAVGQFEPASETPVIAESRRLTSPASQDNLHAIKPIAEALIKTLAGKARTGRLDEMKALELLQQAVLL